MELQGEYLAVFTGAPKPCKRRLLLKTAPIPALSWSIFISLLLQRKPYDSLCSIFLGLCKRVFLFLAAEALLYLGKRAKTFVIKGVLCNIWIMITSICSHNQSRLLLLLHEMQWFFYCYLFLFLPLLVLLPIVVL